MYKKWWILRYSNISDPVAAFFSLIPLIASLFLYPPVIFPYICTDWYSIGKSLHFPGIDSLYSSIFFDSVTCQRPTWSLLNLNLIPSTQFACGLCMTSSIMALTFLKNTAMFSSFSLMQTFFYTVLYIWSIFLLFHAIREIRLLSL